MAAASADTWAVIACTSQYFHNYRHLSNALSMYHAARRLGVPDSRIVLMLGAELACDARNARPSQMFNSAGQRALDLYSPDIEVDYRGPEVTVQSFLAVLTDRLPPGTPASRRLQSGADSRVLVYLAGHGGDQFIKFRDHQEMTSDELGAAFQQARWRHTRNARAGTPTHTYTLTLRSPAPQMAVTQRYAEMLVLVDTCQASSLLQPLAGAQLPGAQAATEGTGPTDEAAAAAGPIVGLTSSALGENSYSLEVDTWIGAALSDRFTYFTHRFLSSLLPDALPGPSSQLHVLQRGLSWSRELRTFQIGALAYLPNWVHRI